MDNDNLLLGLVLGVIGSRENGPMFATILLRLQHPMQDYISLGLDFRQDSVVVRCCQNRVALCKLQETEDCGACQSCGEQ